MNKLPPNRVTPRKESGSQLYPCPTPQASEAYIYDTPVEARPTYTMDNQEPRLHIPFEEINLRKSLRIHERP